MSNRQESKALRMGCTIGYGIGAIGEGIGYNVFFSLLQFFPHYRSRNTSCRCRRDLQRGGVMGRRYGSDDRKLVRYYQKSKRQKTSL